MLPDHLFDHLAAECFRGPVRGDHGRETDKGQVDSEGQRSVGPSQQSGSHERRGVAR